MTRIKEKLNEKQLINIANAIGIIIMVLGVITSLRMNLVNRSFWIDEAMLAYSFTKRGLFNLVSQAFEMNQSAPVLYLYICKIVSLIFGNTEFVLRMVSVVFFAITLMLTTLCAKKLFRMKLYCLPGAAIANMNLFLIQSNNFKQYIFETAVVLTVMYAYFLLTRGDYVESDKSYVKRAVILGIILAVSLWGANPAAFLAGGILAYEFLAGLIHKSKRRIIRCLSWGGGVAVSFIVYYLVWLRTIAAGDEMQDYWEGQAFPLIPTCKDDIKEIIALIYDIFIEFREGRILFLGLLIAGFIVGIFVLKNKYVRIVALTILVSLVASYIHMFPIANRLWAYSYPLFVLVGFANLDWAVFGYASDGTAMTGEGLSEAASYKQNEKNNSIITDRIAGTISATIVMLTAIFCMNGLLVYKNPDNAHMSGEEVNGAISYVQENIQADEMVYVYHGAIPGLKYKIGDEATWIGADYSAETGKDSNIIWSEGTANNEEHLKADLEKIMDAGRCYILASHTTVDRFMPLVEALEENGNLSVVWDEYSTPLYYFELE